MFDDLVANINSILNRITTPKLSAYAYTQNQLHFVNVSCDQNHQRAFNRFYRVMLPITVAYATYYGLIEQNKNNNNPSFQSILKALFKATGRVKTLFGSKLLATVNPNVAPLNSIVPGHLGLRLPISSGQSSNARTLQCVDIHNNLVTRMNTLITPPQFQTFSKKEDRFICSAVPPA